MLHFALRLSLLANILLLMFGSTLLQNFTFVERRHYLSKFKPGLDAAFQRPKVHARCKIDKSDAVWYIRSPLSHNLLCQMLRRISVDAQLSCMYTYIALDLPLSFI